MAKADPLTVEQVKSMMEELSKTRYANRNVFLFEFMLNAPLRVSDVRLLKVKDVLNKNSFKLVQQKKRKKENNEVEVFVSDTLKEIIRKYVTDNKLKQNDYLFEGQRKKPIGTKQIRRIIQDAAEKSGVKIEDDINISCHSTRKTWALNALDKWGSDQIYTISEMLGHTSLESTKHYLHRTRSKYREMVNQLKIY